VIVAVAVVRVVQVALDEIVDVIAMRDGLMPAVPTVNVTLDVTAAHVVRRAGRRVRRVDGDRALVDVTVVRPMKVTVVHVVRVPGVGDRDVATAGAMLVFVLLVGLVLGHVHLVCPSCADERTSAMRWRVDATDAATRANRQPVSPA
jgi:hypothetical protein